MSKKPCFWGPLDGEHGKSVETMFWSEGHQNSSITVKVVALEKVSFSDTQNPTTVC